MNNYRKEQQTRKIAFIGKSPGKRKEQVGGKEQMSEKEIFIKRYLEFKSLCVRNLIFDTNEIIKLYEVLIKNN